VCLSNNSNETRKHKKVNCFGSLLLAGREQKTTS